jgi:hypothetical protein
MRLFSLLWCLVFCSEVLAQPVPSERPRALDGGQPSAPRASRLGDFRQLWPRMYWLESHTFPKALTNYRTVCSVPIEGGYFTLALGKPGDEALFAFSGQPITNEISKGLSFGGPGVPDWGFAYDRNGDGVVDAFFFLVGPGAFEPPEIKERVPPSQGGPVAMNSEEGRLLLANMRLVFTLYADDDFDGHIDAVVNAMRDPERPAWWYRRAVLRSGAVTPMVDEHWTFANDIDARLGPVPQTAAGFAVGVSPGKPVTKPLEQSSRMLDAINGGLRKCRSASSDPFTLPAGPPELSAVGADH